MAIHESVQDAINALLAHDKAKVRVQAVEWLAGNVQQMNDEEYDAAKKAIERGLSDANPNVLMAAMQAIGAFNRRSVRIEEVYEEDPNGEEAEAVAAVCKVCGKPEMLINPATCEESNCPYR